jgi:hypothetical protein
MGIQVLEPPLPHLNAHRIEVHEGRMDGICRKIGTESPPEVNTSRISRSQYSLREADG